MTDAPSSRELARREPEILDPEQVKTLGIIADNMGKSGLFPDAKTGQAAFAKIMLGRSLGLGAAQSMTGIHIVEGKPQIAATTLAGFVREHPDYDYRVIAHDEKVCRIEFLRGEEVLGESAFTLDEAKTAGLVKDKSAWVKYPRNMLFARAMSNGVRWYCPDLFGGVPVYTEADEFTVRPSLSAGEGDGEPLGIELPPTVEAVLSRAESLGHASLANRAAVEVVIDGADEERVAEWVERAEADLDKIEVVEDAEVVAGEGEE